MHGLSCSVGRGILPNQGSNLCPLHWQVDSLPLSLEKTPRPSSLNCAIYCNSPTIQFAHYLCSDQFLSIFIVSKRSFKPICSLSLSLHPQPLTITNSLSVSRFVYFGMFLVNGIIRYVAFHDWLPKSLKKKIID